MAAGPSHHDEFCPKTSSPKTSVSLPEPDNAVNHTESFLIKGFPPSKQAGFNAPSPARVCMFNSMFPKVRVNVLSCEKAEFTNAGKQAKTKNLTEQIYTLRVGKQSPDQNPDLFC
jgi:hypothetical protein